jgi:hypothetical protein
MNGKIFYFLGGGLVVRSENIGGEGGLSVFFVHFPLFFFWQSAGRNESRDATFGGQNQAGLQVVCLKAS